MRTHFRSLGLIAVGVAVGVIASLVLIDGRPAQAGDAAPAADVVLVSDQGGTDASAWSLSDRPLPRIPLELSQEMIDTALAVAADLDTDLATRLAQFHRRDPQAFERQLLRSRRLLALAETKLRQPHLYELKLYELTQDAKIMRMARELREQLSMGGQSAATVELENELRKELFLQLGLSHRSQRDYLDCLEGVIQRVEAEIEEEAANAPAIVEQRLRELIGPVTDAAAPDPIS